MTVDTERVDDLDDLLDADDDGRRRVPLLGGVDRPAGPRSGARAQRVDPRRPRPRRGARPGTSRAPAGLPARPPRHRAARSCRGRGLLNHATHRRLQRGVVPRGTAAARRRDRVDPAVLPSRSTPSGRGTACTGGGGLVQYQFLVPFGAGGGAAPCRDPLRRARHAELPVRAQALRRRQPGAAELPGAGVDAHPRHPSRRRRPGRTARRARRRRARQPADGTISPRTPSPRQRPSAAAIRASPSGRPSATPSIRTVGGRAIRVAGCGSPAGVERLT